MTTVQVPKAFVRALPRFQVHRRQPFYEVLARALATLATARGDPPP